MQFIHQLILEDLRQTGLHDSEDEDSEDEEIIQLVDERLVQAGLTPERIEQFEKFNADESLVGDQCPVCLIEVSLGDEFLSLGCHKKHFLCEGCAHGWFRNHKTCPICRHVFA